MQVCIRKGHMISQHFCEMYFPYIYEVLNNFHIIAQKK